MYVADELVEVYTEHGEPTRLIKRKARAHNEGDYHPCVHFFVTDGKSNLLAQFRGPECGHMRNVWDPIGVAGHISAWLPPILHGDQTAPDPILSAFKTGAREAEEELGIAGLDLDLLHTHNCRYLGITRGDFLTEDGWTDRTFSHNFLLLLPGVRPEHCRLEEGKVLAVRWMDIDNEVLPTLDGRDTGLKFADRQPDQEWMLRLACAGAKLMQAGY